MATEGKGLTDSIYLAVFSATTVGYGDLSFNQMWGRLFATFWLFVSTAEVVPRASTLLSTAILSVLAQALLQLSTAIFSLGRASVHQIASLVNWFVTLASSLCSRLAHWLIGS